jgi:acyl-CoA thioesterase I
VTQVRDRERAFYGAAVVRFLKHLLRRIPGKVVLVRDGARMRGLAMSPTRRLFCLAAVLAGAAVLSGARAAPLVAPDYRVTRIRFFPRPGHAAEMKGGKFVGSLTSATNDFQDLAEVTEPPAEGAWTELTVPAGRLRAYRFVKYQARNDVWADAAEIEFYAGDRKLAGAPFGTTGSGEAANDPKRAFDGDTGTYFRGTGGFNQYVGLDLGTPSQVAPPVFSVAQGAYPKAQAVTITTTTPGARILYSVDGPGRPSIDEKGRPEGGGAWYDGKPIPIAKSAIVQAVAVKPGLADSAVAIAAYRIGGADAAAAGKERAQFHIGNSLTDTVHPWMETLAASGGHRIRYYRFTIPGAPTDWLWDHPGSGFGESNYAQAFLARAPLTDLITQPFAGHGRSIDNEAEHSGRFFDLARAHSPGLQMWLYVQWPGSEWSRDNWANGFADFNGKKVTFGEPATTWQEAVRNHVRYTERVMDEMNRARAAAIRAGTCKPVRIIPGGLALAELKTRIEAGKVPGMKDFFAEVFHSPTDFHMTSKGAYLVSLVHYACLYGDDPQGKVTSAGSGLTEEQAQLFQRIAWETAKNYPDSGLSAASARKASAATLSGAPAAGRAIRILPLGDSITQGGRTDRPEYTYRYPLFYRLKGAGYDIDFIGSEKAGLQPEATWPARNGVPFDPDHEGHYGWKTAQVHDKLGAWLAAYPDPPDIVLVHLGTNDQGAADYGQAVVRPLREMIALLRAKNPRVVVLVGHLAFNGGAALKIRPLVEAMARELDTPASPVVTVAHYTGWRENPDATDSDTFDWAHPNPRGQQKMAEKWFAAMTPHLKRLKAQRATKRGR